MNNKFKAISIHLIRKKVSFFGSYLLLATRRQIMLTLLIHNISLSYCRNTLAYSIQGLTSPFG